MATRRLWAAVALMLAVGCQTRQPEPSAGTSSSDESRADALRALGYTDFASTAARPGLAGVSIVDSARTAPGYTLYVDHGACRAVLLGADGAPARAWSYSPCGLWAPARLARGGDLIVVGSDDDRLGPTEGDPAKRYLLRFDWGGRLRWRRDLPAHHDVEENAGGTLTTLTQRRRSVDLAGGQREIVDNGVLQLSADGVPAREVSLFDACRRAETGFELRVPEIRGPWAGRPVDLFHANSVQTLDGTPVGPGALFGHGRVLVSSRTQDALLLVDLRSSRVVWTWGRGVLSGPHDATLLPGGTVLVFDNGLARRWSRVLEIAPASGQNLWEYRADPPGSFFTAARGSAQRLTNGNTLVANSDSGEAFEVTPGRDVVWRFWNPRLGPDGRRAAIVRARRYSPAFIERLGP